ncbi:hypothetical protein KFE25_000089 [Diacronema lutheri]|uniref:Uncharacterized protein n=1 Tax=Diacronema lutheri TaxID=2081491 RepID=A0A8J5XF04_DIALT|nr:hypothetical protein KFE25_000089 [Diacronema lutheri]
MARISAFWLVTAVSVARTRAFALTGAGRALPVLTLATLCTARGSADPLLSGADRALSLFERAAKGSSRKAGELRRQISGKTISPTVYEAAAAGGATGWLCGAVLVGDTRVMAVAGACAFVYAQQKQPDNRWASWANRLTAETHVLRVRAVDAVRTPRL